MHILSRHKYRKYKLSNPYLYQYFESEQYYNDGALVLDAQK